MKTSTLKIIINMFHASSDDVTRDRLCGVNIKPLKDNIVRIQATDGYILSYVDVVDASLFRIATELDSPTLHNDLEPLLKALDPKLRTDSDLDYNSGNLSHALTIAVNIKSPYKSNFPKTEQFIPKKSDKPLEGASLRMGIDPRLILKVNKSWGYKKGGVVFEFRSGLDAFTMEKEIEGLIFKAVVMPIRL